MNDSLGLIKLITEGRKGSVPIMYQMLSRLGFEAPVVKNRLSGSMTMGRCFENAAVLVHRKPELIYCEGFASQKDLGIPLEHAWCLTPEGEILDPTWREPTDYYGCAFRADKHRLLQNITGYHGVFAHLHRLRKPPSETARFLQECIYDPRELPV